MSGNPPPPQSGGRCANLPWERILRVAGALLGVLVIILGFVSIFTSSFSTCTTPVECCSMRALPVDHSCLVLVHLLTPRSPALLLRPVLYTLYYLCAIILIADPKNLVNSIYRVLFGALIILAELRMYKWLKFFSFLTSYFGLGRAAMCASLLMACDSGAGWVHWTVYCRQCIV